MSISILVHLQKEHLSDQIKSSTPFGIWVVASYFFHCPNRHCCDLSSERRRRLRATRFLWQWIRLYCDTEREAVVACPLTFPNLHRLPPKQKHFLGDDPSGGQPIRSRVCSSSYCIHARRAGTVSCQWQIGFLCLVYCWSEKCCFHGSVIVLNLNHG